VRHGLISILFYLRGGDCNEVWENHLEDQQTLKDYAKAMKELATNHWEKDKSRGTHSIIYINKYFSCSILYILPRTMYMSVGCRFAVHKFYMCVFIMYIVFIMFFVTTPYLEIL